MQRQLSRQEQLNDLLSAVITAAMVDSTQELEVWVEEEGFSCGSFSQYGSMVRLVIDVEQKFQHRTERRFSHVKNLGAVLKNQGW